MNAISHVLLVQDLMTTVHLVIKLQTEYLTLKTINAFVRMDILMTIIKKNVNNAIKIVRLVNIIQAIVYLVFRILIDS